LTLHSFILNHPLYKIANIATIQVTRAMDKVDVIS